VCCGVCWLCGVRWRAVPVMLFYLPLAKNIKKEV